MPNTLSQFWQELKRRRVIRVITVYAASAFVILELLSIIIEPLKLPEWTLQFAIVFLCIGFIVAIILSWIYDIHPKGGIVKTGPSHRIRTEDVPKSSNSWKIVSYISFVVIGALIVLNITSYINAKEDAARIDKSIAVLPFTSLSDDPEKQYLADGVMDAILLHLSKIEDLRVMSRTSVEQYRVTKKKATEICEELDVAFILEGSFRKYGDQARLIVQLIQSGREDHAWANQYDRQWEDIFAVESEVAQSIAQELKAVITLEEKELIEKKQTNNLDAYDYYLLGQNYYNSLYKDSDLWTAIDYYQQAIELDSTYALAYAGIAEVYLSMVSKAIIAPMDAYPKAKKFAISALEINEELENSHSVLGLVYEDFDLDFTAAESEFIRALEINPNSHTAHLRYAYFLSHRKRHDEALSHVNIALVLDPVNNTMSAKSRILFAAGFESEALLLAEELCESYPDNPYNYWRCAVIYAELGMYNKAISMLQTQITYMENDNISDEIGLLGYLHGRLGQIDNALKYLDQLDELSAQGIYVAPRARIRVYLGLGNIDKAIEIIKNSIENRSINLSYLDRVSDENLRKDPRFIEILRNAGVIE